MTILDRFGRRTPEAQATVTDAHLVDNAIQRAYLAVIRGLDPYHPDRGNPQRWHDALIDVGKALQPVVDPQVMRRYVDGVGR